VKSVGFEDITRFLNGPTLVGFLIIFVMLGGYLRWYVYGPAHDREVNGLVKRCERSEGNAEDWKKIAEKQMEANQKLAANQEVQLAMIRAFISRNGPPKSG
jgi:hypothetical protein